MIKAVIFDFYGVFVTDQDKLLISEVVEYNPDAARAMSDAMKAYNLGMQTFDYVISIFSERTHKTEEEVREQFKKDMALDKRLVEYVLNIRSKGIKTVLLSNTGGESIRHYLDEQNLESLFDQMVLSFEVGMIKPNIGIYLLAAERLGVEPSEAMFVDDRSYNCDGAVLAGMQALLYSDFAQFKEALEPFLPS
jgi:HAD superfamily hydrolase (TIGR01509 family)